jgi:hypothetical protein
VTPTETLFIHFSSAAAATGALSLARAAPFSTNDTPGRAWNVADTA